MSIADKSQIKEQENRVRRKDERDLEDMRFILATTQGRRVIWRYLETCGVFKSSANNSGSWTYFYEGQRNIGLMLLADVENASPEAYLQMKKEAKEEKNV